MPFEGQLGGVGPGSGDVGGGDDEVALIAADLGADDVEGVFVMGDGGCEDAAGDADAGILTQLVPPGVMTWPTCCQLTRSRLWKMGMPGK